MFNIYLIIFIPYSIFFLISIIFQKKIPIFNLLIIFSFLFSNFWYLLTKKPISSRINKKVIIFFFINFIIWICLSFMFLIISSIQGFNPTYIILSSLVFVKHIIVLFFLCVIYFCYRGKISDVFLKKNLNSSVVLSILYLLIIISFIEFVIFKFNIDAFFYRVNESGFSKNFYFYLGETTLLKTFGIFRSSFENGIVLVTLFFLLLGLKRYFFKSKLPFWVTIVVLFISIIISFTRNVCLMFFLSLISFIFFEKLSLRKIVLFHIISLIVIPFIVYKLVFFVFPEIGVNLELYQSVYTRLTTFAFLKEYIEKHLSLLNLLFGFGISQINYKNPLGIDDTSFAIDNLYMFLFLYSGLIGLFLFFSLYYFVTYLLFRIKKKITDKKFKNLIRIALSLWIPIPFIGMFNIVLGNMAVFGVIYYIVLITITFLKEIENDPHSRCRKIGNNAY